MAKKTNNGKAKQHPRDAQRERQADAQENALKLGEVMLLLKDISEEHRGGNLPVLVELKAKAEEAAGIIEEIIGGEHTFHVNVPDEPIENVHLEIQQNGIPHFKFPDLDLILPIKPLVFLQLALKIPVAANKLIDLSTGKQDTPPAVIIIIKEK